LNDAESLVLKIKVLDQRRVIAVRGRYGKKTGKSEFFT